ncbi:MAG: zinc ribbon domain-containing protein [Ignavibacteriales bacterium]|nr:MAG: zinc ribbon domain-containing protein [Ignavibacteriales bacterium]
MPVFEYKCTDCNTKYEVLHKSTSNLSEVTCPSCHSQNSKKLLSSFSASVNDSSSASYGDSCTGGTCGLPSGGCASGMCGLN